MLMFFLYSAEFDIARIKVDESKPVSVEKVSGDFKKKIFDQLRPSVVMIYVKAFHSLDEIWSNGSSKWEGTGFILDKDKGIIATNKHVSGIESVCTYEIQMENGNTTKAHLIYEDPFHDFSFLQFDPKDLPPGAKNLQFCDTDVEINEQIFGVSNMAGSNFSVLKGTVSSLFENTGPFADQSIEFTGTVTSGASGSPMINEEGKLVGILYGGKFVAGRILPAKYLNDAFKKIRDGQLPPRRTIGLVANYVNLNKVLEKNLITKEALDQYKEKFKYGNLKGIKIGFVQVNMPAYSSLEPEDIIWTINGDMLGPQLYMLEKMINENDKIKLGVFRNGKFREIEIETKPIQEKPKRLMSFSGALFSSPSVDKQYRFGLGEDIDRVFLGYAKNSSGFSELGGGGGFLSAQNIIEIKKIDGYDITDLDSFKKILPQIYGRKLLAVTYVNYGIIDPYISYKTIRQNYPRMVFIDNEGQFEDVPKMFEFDTKSHQWKSINIALNNTNDKKNSKDEFNKGKENKKDEPKTSRIGNILHTIKEKIIG